MNLYLVVGAVELLGDYKSRIKKAKDLPAAFRKGDVQLISLAELEQLEMAYTQRYMGT